MTQVLYLSSSNFDKVITENKLVLIDFWATWCGPCKIVSPIIEKIASDYENKLIVAKVDIDKARDIAQNYNIQSIPTVILFKDGKIVSRQIGAMSFEEYEKEINKYC